jgi:Flp pilus assembly pilin Flp
MGIAIAELLPVLLALLREAPALVATGAEVVEGVKKIWAGVTAEVPPTADEQAEYDAALLAAHTALQNS